MRSLEVCKKCKWFKKEGNIMTCNYELSTDPQHVVSWVSWFDNRFYYVSKFIEREIHPDCPLKMEHIVMLDKAK